MQEENDDEFVNINFYNMALAKLFKHYNQFHIALNATTLNYQELIIVKNVIDVY